MSHLRVALLLFLQRTHKRGTNIDYFKVAKVMLISVYAQENCFKDYLMSFSVLKVPFQKVASVHYSKKVLFLGCFDSFLI